MTTTTTRAPYAVGESVRHLVNIAGATCLTNGTVTEVLPTDRGGFRVDTEYPAPNTREGVGFGRFYVNADGSCDYLSAGHLAACFDCGASIDVQDGTATWRGPRDELVCRDAAACAARKAA